MTTSETPDQCVVCFNDMPEGRLLTCSHDCYLTYRTFKHLDQQKSRGKGRQRPWICAYCKSSFHTDLKRLRPRETMHMSRHNAKFCSTLCKEQYAKAERVRAAKVLSRFI